MGFRGILKGTNQFEGPQNKGHSGLFKNGLVSSSLSAKMVSWLDGCFAVPLKLRGFLFGFRQKGVHHVEKLPPYSDQLTLPANNMDADLRGGPGLERVAFTKAR